MTEKQKKVERFVELSNTLIALAICIVICLTIPICLLFNVDIDVFFNILGYMIAVEIVWFLISFYLRLFYKII